MNKRIKKLYDQALESKFDYGANAGVKPGEYYSNYITVLNPEKFAELIVRECIDIVSPYAVRMENFDGGHPIADLKKHFGVEE
jgi:hypothetical protein